MKEDTIAAIATAPGEGGIGIIRISGEKAKDILAKIFVPASGRISPRIFSYGHIKDPASGRLIDEAMAVYMKAPHSYTAEDVVEIQCHGSIVSLRKTLALALANGARLAERGEFTKRAFLNGRLDLAQAEAVIDLIKARTEKTFDLALDQLEGAFSARIRGIREKLADVLVDLTVNIDYPDEDIEELTYEKLLAALDGVRGDLEALLATAGTGKILQEGLKVTIAGKPNVGKSSLLNALMGENRAIVTDIPGTTRDTIEEALSLCGIPVLMTDTAGIHETQDLIEKIGINKSKEAFNKSDLIIFMVDGSQPLTEEDEMIMTQLAQRHVIVLINKADKGLRVKAAEISARLPQAQIIVSAVAEGKGISELKSCIEQLVYGGIVSQQQSVVVTNVRHEKLLSEALSACGDAQELADARQPLEIIEIDIRSCYDALGEIVGETVRDDILDKVFERFCLGK